MQAVYLFQVLMTKKFIFIPLSYDFENSEYWLDKSKKILFFIKRSPCLLAWPRAWGLPGWPLVLFIPAKIFASGIQRE